MSGVAPLVQAALFPKPAYVAFCNKCGGALQWQVVSRNSKGNQGRWYAKCSKLNDEGKPECFKWGSPKSSPSNSPPITTSPTLSSVVDEQAGIPEEGHSTVASTSTCAIPNCSSTRVAAGCEHRCCRKHCLALGGCTLRKHRMTPTEQKRHIPIDPILLAQDDHPLLVLSPPLSTTAHSDALPPATATDHVLSKPTSKTKERVAGDVDILASTRHPSQMPAVFTQGYAQQEALRQQVQAAEIERRALECAAVNTIDTYGWHTDGHDSSTLQVQQGFGYPNLRITSAILTGLGLTSGKDSEHLIQYFNLSLCRWTTIFQGHVVVLQSPHIYLRNLGVTEMPDFDSVLAQSATLSSNPNEPHLRHNLSSERSSVRHAEHQRLIKESRKPSHVSLDATDSEVTSNSSSDEPSRFATTTHTRRFKQVRNAYTQPTHPSPSDPSTPDNESPSPSPTVSSSPRPDGILDLIDLDSDPCGSKPGRVWPRDFYTVEVAEVFNAASAPGINARQAFIQTYGPGVVFRPSTFSEHLKRWNTSPITSRMKFMEAGQTDQGKYALFMKANPSPDGEVKAAKKRLARSNKN
ncbi:hypothetical protein L210DRAFT_3654395 [Boletus edulis BED1]|uniref:GRF-like zinc ribbon domain-containing protein n=1 Tax=Boletus edulis BED1 TaxID=1328754 RepID=A0AAD4BE50_BOLED|nr:hypothetical protein L210DRAFT_3654395 [Boletus edulis BED1]